MIANELVDESLTWPIKYNNNDDGNIINTTTVDENYNINSFLITEEYQHFKKNEHLSLPSSLSSYPWYCKDDDYQDCLSLSITLSSTLASYATTGLTSDISLTSSPLSSVSSLSYEPIKLIDNTIIGNDGIDNDKMEIIQDQISHQNNEQTLFLPSSSSSSSSSSNEIECCVPRLGHRPHYYDYYNISNIYYDESNDSNATTMFYDNGGEESNQQDNDDDDDGFNFNDTIVATKVVENTPSSFVSFPPSLSATNPVMFQHLTYHCDDHDDREGDNDDDIDDDNDENKINDCNNKEYTENNNLMIDTVCTLSSFSSDHDDMSLQSSSSCSSSSSLFPSISTTTKISRTKSSPNKPNYYLVNKSIPNSLMIVKVIPKAEMMLKTQQEGKSCCTSTVNGSSCSGSNSSIDVEEDSVQNTTFMDITDSIIDTNITLTNNNAITSNTFVD